MEDQKICITNLEDIIVELRRRNVKKRIAVVCGTDESTRGAVEKAVEYGLVEAIFVNDDNKDEAARRAVAMVRSGEADILMKGHINSDNILHAILNKQTGILNVGNVLTHIAVSQIPTYGKLLFYSDTAVIPYPSLQQRIEQVKYLAEMCRSFNIACPKISLIHCTEKTNTKLFSFTQDYDELKSMAANGEFGDCIIDGPLDVKSSCNAHNMNVKGIVSPIAGEADALLFPDLITGNVFYKTLSLFGKALTAGILQGATNPVVLPSRGDDAQSKFYSIAMALLKTQS